MDRLVGMMLEGAALRRDREQVIALWRRLLQ